MIISNQQNVNINFKAGKTTIFSDFDGTYMPYSHSSVCSEKHKFPRENFHQTFSEIGNFFNKTKENLEFIITTGRNMPKFNAFLNHIRGHNESIPLPEKVIINNGGDIYRINNCKDFFSTQNPLQATNKNASNEQKLNILKEKTDWEPDKVKNKLINLLRNKGFDVFDTPINEFSESYPHTILEELNKRGYNHQHSMFASIQDDGKTGYYVALNKDISNNSDWFNDIKSNLDKEFAGKNYSIIGKTNDPECGMGTSFRILPKINEQPLNKVFDTKNAIQKIIDTKSNNLIIIAGDDINDVRMLNPFSYVPMSDKTLSKTSENIVSIEESIYELKKHLLKNPNDTMAKDELKQYRALLSIELNQVNQKLEKNPKLKQKIMDLPFCSIAIKKEGKVCPISEEVYNMFKDSGKVIISTPNDYLKSIQSGIKQYAKQNNKFFQGMSETMVNMLGLKNNPKTFAKQKNTMSKFIVVVISAAVALLGTALYLINHKKADNTKRCVK